MKDTTAGSDALKGLEITFIRTSSSYYHSILRARLTQPFRIPWLSGIRR